MSAITDAPNTYDFGLEFNYAVWTANTSITLVNVPWNNDYRDIVKFASRTALNTYIDSIENAGTVVNNLSYVKPNEPIRIDVPFNAAYRFNYLRASNPLQAVPGDVTRDYYYFITDVRYIAPNTTEIVVQLDIWQTFGFDATFGNCYVERGHIGIANTNAFTNYGRSYLTIPEGLDVGGEYQVITKRSKPIMSYDVTGGQDPATQDKFDILIACTADLLADAGTEDDPHLKTADGGNFFTLPSGASYYVFDGTTNSFEQFMSNMKVVPWITQCITSITAIPPIKRYYPTFEFGLVGTPTLAPSSALLPRVYAMFPGWRDNGEIVNQIPVRYRGLKKLWTYPYMIAELTMFTGTPVIIKPESWADADATVLERITVIPPNQRVAIGPYKYNALPGSPTENQVPGFPDFIAGGDDYGEYIDTATQMSSFPTFALVNNGSIGYLAANAHGIAFQYKSNDWSQQRALNSNEVSYDQASSGITLANKMTGIGVRADTAQTGLSNDLAVQKAVVNGIGSIAGGIGGGAVGIAGGVGSAVMGGIGAAMDINYANQSLAVRNNAARSSNRAQVGNAGYIRDTNKDLADFSARGDYQNTVAGINAKVQDAHLIQPSTSGQVGGETLNIVNNNAVVSVRFKMIDQSAMRVVGEYWLRYGYAVRQFLTPPTNMMVMTKFTYWKLTESYLVAGGMPETFKQTIRGIFEKGVTVWADPSDIGNIDMADNQPIAGIAI